MCAQGAGLFGTPSAPGDGIFGPDSSRHLALLSGANQLLTGETLVLIKKLMMFCGAEFDQPDDPRDDKGFVVASSFQLETNTAHQDIWRQLKKHDTDGDGQISLSEFRRMLLDMALPALVHINETPKAHRPLEHWLFALQHQINVIVQKKIIEVRASIQRRNQQGAGAI